MRVHTSERTFPTVDILKVLISVGTIVLLLLSWGALFWFIRLETELSLPYDTSWYDYWGWPQASPPPGSWQRNLNYFFESPFGSMSSAILTVGASIFFLVLTFFRTPQFREKTIPLWMSFAVSNLVSIPVMFLISYVVRALFAGRLTGWNGTIILWLPTLFLLVLLFTLQVRIVPRKFLRRLH